MRDLPVGGAAVGFEPRRGVPSDPDEPVLAAQPERALAVPAHGPDGEALVAAGDGFQPDEAVKTALHGHADAVVGGDPDVAAVVLVDARDDVVRDRGRVARLVHDVPPLAVGTGDVDAFVGSHPQAAVAAAHEAAHGNVPEFDGRFQRRGVEPHQSVFGAEQQGALAVPGRGDIADEVAVPAVEERDVDLAHATVGRALVDFVVRPEVERSIGLAAAGDVPLADDLLGTDLFEALPVPREQHQSRGGADPQRVVVLEQGADVPRSAGIEVFEIVVLGVVEAQSAVGAGEHSAVAVLDAQERVDRVVAERSGVVALVGVGHRAVRIVARQAVRRAGPDVTVPVRRDGEDRIETVVELLEIGACDLGTALLREAREEDQQSPGDRSQGYLARCHRFRLYL